LEIAARSAYSQVGDEWASAEYRQDVAGVLAARCLDTAAGK
jgi:CO/xanthine dehydrogenase FAD-binding subunit